MKINDDATVQEMKSMATMKNFDVRMSFKGALIAKPDRYSSESVSAQGSGTPTHSGAREATVSTIITTD
jgi:hypothetical protein